MTAVAVLLAWAASAWIVSAGRVRWLPLDSNNLYDLLADGFRSGRLSLAVAPPDELLALPDPYAPAANAPWRLHDAVLHDGRYYLYWGPVPAGAIALVKSFSGIERVHDALLGLALMAVVQALLGLIVLGVWRRSGAGSLVVLGAVQLAAMLVAPLPFLLARIEAYEIAILGGQFFALAGVGLMLRSFAPASGVVSRPMLAAGAAGVCFALAGGCRISLLPACAVAAALAGWMAVGPYRPVRRRLAVATAALLPVLATVGLLATYNHARFGSPTESGVRYMLASAAATRALRAGAMTSPAYAPLNVLNYAAAPPRWGGGFPFVRAGDGIDFAAAGWSAPRHYRVSHAAGLVLIAPWLTAALVPLARAARRAADRTNDGDEGAGGPDMALSAWAAMLIGFAVLAATPWLFMFYCTMRYLADVTPMLALAAGVGWFGLTRPTATVSTTARRAAHFVMGGLLIFSIGMSVLLGVTGYSDHFASRNSATAPAARP